MNLLSAWKGALHATLLTPSQGADLAMLTRAHLAKPASAQQQAEWLKESSDALVRVHGHDGARTRLDMAKKLAQKDRVLSHTLTKAGILSHPKVVAMFSEVAFSQAARGKL